MKELNLNFMQRVNLCTFLGNANGPLAKMLSLGRVYDAVRITDEEMREVKITDLGDGTSRLEAPATLDFGKVKVAVEDADAAAVVAEIDSCQNFRITDMIWVKVVREALNGR